MQGVLILKAKGIFFLAIIDPERRFLSAFRNKAVVFYVFCELWILDRHDSCLVAFLIEFRSFQYIICYFWWLVQGVLVLKVKMIFFWQFLIRPAIFDRRCELGLWCFVFFVSYRSWNGMILMWLRSLLISDRFGILYAIFGGLCREF